MNMRQREIKNETGLKNFKPETKLLKLNLNQKNMSCSLIIT